jgi:tetratricopeptide (TPR) repeat protein
MILHEGVMKQEENQSRVRKIVGLAIVFTLLIVASLACKLSVPQPTATPTVRPTIYKSWSASPTPLPEITFPPPIQDHALLDQAEAEFQTGIEAYHAENWQEALDAFNAALEIDPRHAQAYYYRGWTYLNIPSQGYLSTYLQYNDQSIMDFTRTLALDPYNAKAHFGRGVCYHHRAQVEPLREYRKLWQQLALEDLDRTLEIDPEHGRAFGERVAIYLERMECDKALDDLLTIYGAYIPASDDTILFIKTYRCQKNYSEALRLVNEEIAKDPNANLFWERGMIYGAQKDYDRATADLDTAAQVWTGDFVPGTLWYNRAAIEYALGNYDLAKEYIERGKPQTWIDWGSPYYYLGKIYLSEGNNEQAIIAFTWAEQTLDEGEYLDATRNELRQLGVLSTDLPYPTNVQNPATIPSPTPESTPTPTKIEEQILQAYGGLVSIQIDATFLNELTSRTPAEKFDDPQTDGVIHILEDFLQDTDGVLAQATVPDSIAPDWEKALVIHGKVKDLLYQWINRDIESLQVVTEMEPLLSELESIITDTEKILSNEYGYNIDELTKQRQDSLANVYRIFGLAATPTTTK